MEFHRKQTIIRKLREDRDLLQKELGVLVGCSNSKISQFERRDRTVPSWTAIRLSNVFGLPVQAFLDQDGRATEIR